MSGKLKLTLLLLALAAPLSLSYLWSITKPSTMAPRANVLAQLETFSLLDDADGDGLSNQDENLWRTDWQDADSDNDGYKDGEEVLTGHDPTKKGPNDFLDPDKNLTEHASMLILGSIYNGTLVEGGPSNQIALMTVADAIFDEYQKFALAPRNTSVNVVPNSREALSEYLDIMLPHLQESFPSIVGKVSEFLRLYGSVDAERTEEIINDEARYTRLMNDAFSLQADLEAFSFTLTEIPVPEDMARPHKNGVALLQHMSTQVGITTTLKEDPVKAVLASTALAGFISRTTVGFIYDYFKTLETVLPKYNAPEEVL